MKKNIVIVSLFIISLLTMLPFSSVVESNIVKEKIEQQPATVISEINYNKLKDQDKNNTREPLFFLAFLLKQLLRIFRIIKLGIILIIIKIIIGGEPSDDWWNTDWLYRKQITIDHTKVEGDLSNFPLLVSHASSDFADNAQPDGDDFVFIYSNGNEQMQLSHEIEYYDDVTGNIVSWVKIPFLSSIDDTKLYLYYGNLNCNSQQFPDKVWNPQFKAVWHLHESPTGTIHDSTLNDNDGTSYGSMTPSDLTEGKVGNCIEFDGDNDYISVPDDSTLKPTDVTLIAWFRPLEEDVPNGYVVSKSSDDTWSNADGHTYGFGFRLGKDGSNWIDARFERDTKEQQQEHAGHYYTTNNAWHHLTLTFDENTDNAHFYVNGVLNGTAPSCHSSVLWYPDPWDFLMGASRQHEGSSHNPNTFFKCRIDEVRVLNITVNASWVSTEYNNQYNPSSFLSFGPEETELIISDFNIN